MSEISFILKFKWRYSTKILNFWSLSIQAIKWYVAKLSSFRILVHMWMNCFILKYFNIWVKKNNSQIINWDSFSKIDSFVFDFQSWLFCVIQPKLYRFDHHQHRHSWFDNEVDFCIRSLFGNFFRRCDTRLVTCHQRHI